MTVCAVSTFIWFYGENDHGVAAVTASDRMLSDSGLGIEYESSRIKAAFFGSHHMVLVAGDLSTNSLILQGLNETLAGQPPQSTVNLAISIGDVIGRLNADRAHRIYLNPLGLSADVINSKPNGLAGFGLPNSLIEQICAQMQSESFNCEAIVIGCDDRSLQMYRVDGRGIFTCHTDIGFLSIGSGGIHSSAYFMQIPYKHTVGYIDALRNTFFAKKRAEVSPGVGRATDMFIVTGTGIIPIPNDQIGLLDKAYKEFQKQSEKLLNKLTVKLSKEGQKTSAVENIDNDATIPTATDRGA